MQKFKNIIFLSIIAYRSTISGNSAPQASAQVICWLESRKLTRADFQASTEPKSTGYDVLANTFLAATTEANAIIYDQTTLPGYYLGSVVSVQFDKQKSWLSREFHFDTTDVIAHEQLHFDIVELTGRKIRRVLARCAAQHTSHHTPPTEAEINCIYDEEDDLQLLYDKEAGSGDNPKAQAWWQAFIHRELAKLSEFASTPKDCLAP